MKNFIIGLILTISPFLALSHNPLSAKFHLEAGEHASLLTINLSQDGVNQVLAKSHSQAALSALNQKEWEEMIVDYIKNRFSLILDSKAYELGKGGIKLGGHQTDLRFVLPPISKEAKKIEVDIPAFKENPNHQSIFSYSIYGKEDHMILKHQNNYQSSKTITQTTKNTNWLFYILIGIILIFTLAILTWKK